MPGVGCWKSKSKFGPDSGFYTGQCKIHVHLLSTIGDGDSAMSSRLLTIVPPVDRHKLRLEPEGMRIAIAQFDILLSPMDSCHVRCIQNIHAISDRVRLARSLSSLSTFSLSAKQVYRA